MAVLLIHVSTEHVLMNIGVSVKQDTLEQTVISTSTSVPQIHVSMEHVLIWLMDTTVPVKQDTLEQTVTCFRMQVNMLALNTITPSLFPRPNFLLTLM